MPVFGLVAGGTAATQWQPGDIALGSADPGLNANSGFGECAPDLYLRPAPFSVGPVYVLGQPWPMSPYSSDQTSPSLVSAAADEWRIVQLNQIELTTSVINGTASISEADDTLSGTGTLLIQGTLSRMEADDTLSAAGTLTIKGSASITEANDTLSATGALALNGAASITEAGDAVTSTSTLLIKGAVGVTEADDTLAATGTAQRSGVVDITEANDAVTASGAAPTPIISLHRRGAWDERQEFERRQREWAEDLRRIIDRSWRIANGEIDPITFEPIPPPDYSLVNAALAAQAISLDRRRAEAFIAEAQRRQEDDAIAVLLLAA
jgi:hypothetical protein